MWHLINSSYIQRVLQTSSIHPHNLRGTEHLTNKEKLVFTENDVNGKYEKFISKFYYYINTACPFKEKNINTKSINFMQCRDLLLFRDQVSSKYLL